MFPSKIEKHGALQAMLLQVPELVTAAANRDPMLEERMQAWMVRAEQFLKLSGNGEAAEMAGLRARMITAQAQDAQHGQRQRQKWQAATAVIEEAQAVLQSKYRPLDAAIEAARSVIQQMIAIINLQRLYEGGGRRSMAEEAFFLWENMLTFSVLHNGVVQLKAALPTMDILQLLQEAIEAGDMNFGLIS